MSTALVYSPMRQLLRPARTNPQREAILNLWSRGHKEPFIAAKLDITDKRKVTNIVRSARRSMDRRALVADLTITIPPQLHATIRREAAARGTDMHGILMAVVTNAFADIWFLKIVLNEDGGP